MLKRFILPLWIVAAIGLFLYSFTQVDLSLTLSRASIFQDIEKSFQYIGWFNRPISTYLFLGIVIFTFALYAITLNLVSKKLIDRKNLIRIILFVSGILFLSYCAFSYDLFNYIFDAKILTHYHQNPYFHKALDYPGEPMLSFMRWTHRTYPYGPAWLVLTVPFSYVGFGIFMFTFYLFKILMLGSFIGSVFLIERISKKMDVNPLFAMAAFALNPLVLIESLVSAHNDIVMMFFALLSIWMFLEKKYVKSFMWLAFSILIKFATVLIIPGLFAKGVLKVGRDMFFYVLIVSMLLAVLAASFRTQFQPWYLLYVLTFAAFVQNKYFIGIPVFVLSIAALFQYVPYLYLGNWDPPVQMILANIMYGGVIISGLSILVFTFLRPKKVK